MQPSTSANTQLTVYYARAIEALCEIAHSLFFMGKLDRAIHTLRHSLDLIAVDEVAQKDQLKLLLLYARVLNVDHLLNRGETDLLFSVLRQAQEIAESSQDQQGQADVLCLLGQVYCNTTTIAIVKSGAMPFGAQYRERYMQALMYHEQAHAIQEALDDTRGMCESLFGIGLIYQFWQQHSRAYEYFTKAIQIAEQHGYLLEQAEPHRHLTMDALFKGDLDTALTHALQALAFRKAGNFRPYQLLDHVSLWDIYLKQGDRAQADWHMQQATDLAQELGMSTLISSMITSLKRLRDQSA